MSGGSARMSGPEAADAGVVELEHGPVPENRLRALAAQDEPRRAVPRARPVALQDLPAALHAQVAAEHEPVLEAEEQVLADRFDTEQAPAVEAACDAGHAGPRMRRLDLELLADERLEPRAARWSRVALGHRVKRMHARFASSSGRLGRGARLERARAGRSAALPKRLLGRGRAREGVHARAGLAAARARDPCPERRDLRARVLRGRCAARPGIGAVWRSSSRWPST